MPLLNEYHFMKRKQTLLVLVLSFMLSLSCTRDDICVDPDTPLLVIRFYDIADRTTPKVVPGLRVIGIRNGNEPPEDAVVNTFSDRVSTLDSIGIPLRTVQDMTDFIFIINSADDDMTMETGNNDSLRFNYDVQEVFISRACGFVANYAALSSDLTADENNWIQDIEITNPLVENEASAHVKIFH